MQDILRKLDRRIDHPDGPKTKETVKVTVLMSVYNGANHLKDAIDSVLNQTFTNFEFLILDDGSTDRSLEIIEAYDDRRMRVIKNKNNIGLTRSLNSGLKLAQGEYIARMDCDDICLPCRLETQVEFMVQNPEVGVCGSWVTVINGAREYVRKYPVSHDEISCFMLFRTPFAHPSVMVRRQVLTSNRLQYNTSFKYAQDVDLWARCSEVCKMQNIDKPLIKYREHPDQIGKKHRVEQKSFSNSVRKEILRRSGLLDDSQIDEAHRCLRLPPDANEAELDLLKFWLTRLKRSNKIRRCYPEPVFSSVLSWRLFLALRQTSFSSLEPSENVREHTVYDFSTSAHRNVPSGI